MKSLSPTLCDPMDCSLPGSSVHGIFQARVLEWVAISLSRGSSQPRDWTQVFRTAGRRFTLWATREAHFKTIAYRMTSQAALLVKTAWQCRRHKWRGFNPWVRKSPWRRTWQPTPVFLPGESHGQRSLEGYSPGVTQSQTRLRYLGTHARNIYNILISCIKIVLHSHPSNPDQTLCKVKQS